MLDAYVAVMDAASAIDMDDAYAPPAIVPKQMKLSVETLNH